LGRCIAMSILRFLLNLLWVLTGGFWMFVAWIVAAGLVAGAIIRPARARAAVHILLFYFLPLGRPGGCRGRFSPGAELWHRALRLPRQCDLARPRRLVAGACPSCHRDHARHHDHRPSLCLGASEADRHLALADRAHDRDLRRGVVTNLTCDIVRVGQLAED